MEAEASVHSLDDDSLGALIGCFPPKFRASTISLVCKTWQRVEREHPHRPTELNLRPEDFTAAFLKWHCRDTSGLKAVRVSQDVQPLAVDSYRQRLPGLLRHLHAWAPSLRVLELVPPAAVQGKDGRCEGQGILPLICTLSRLEGLALRQWSYSAEDVATFQCLTQLQNLKVLELAELVLCNQREDGAGNVPVWRAAYNLLQVTILSLQLTGLGLIHIDFLSAEFLPSVPVQEVGGLTKLRSLVYQIDWLPEDGRFPRVDRLVQLTRFELAAHVRGGKLRDTFTALTDLKELEVSFGWYLQRVELAGAAEVTKLTVRGRLGSSLESVLPLQTLQHVRDLNIHCFPNRRGEMEWPRAWMQLASLTRLAYRVEHLGDPNAGVSGLPYCLVGTRLVVIQLTTGHELFLSRGKEYVRIMTINCPRLTQLQIEVRGIPEDEEERLGEACAALRMLRPDWECSLGEPGPTRVVMFCRR